MVEAPQLSPHELDRVEDALEGLEGQHALLDDSPAVQRLLEDYRQILVASRVALPMLDVPRGVLDSVLAEARRSTDADVLGIQEPPPEPSPPSFWAKLRKGLMIPGLAVAGTAVIVLLLVKPTMRDAPVVAQAEDGKAGNTVSKKTVSAGDEPAPAFGSAQPAESPANLDALAAPEDAEAEPAAEGELVEIATSRAGKSGGLPGAAPASPPALGAEDKASRAVAGRSVAGDVIEDGKKAAKEDADGDDERAADWDAVEEGDKARKNGDCFAARNAYRRALDDGNDSVRARAHAGIGLCEIVEGDDAAASEHFDQAEALDPEVENYIATQTPDAPKPTAKAKRKAPKKRKSVASPSKNEYDSPFNE